MNKDEIPEYTDRQEAVKRKKITAKPLYKFRIRDLKELRYVEHGDYFKYIEHEVNMVMAGGKIIDIYRDDNVMFSFEMDDGTGSIKCFHKFKGDREGDLAMLRTKAETVKNATIRQDTIFNDTNHNSFLQKKEHEVNEAFCELMDWFEKEIIEKEKIREMNDIIHVKGYLIENEGTRKINVLEFRVVQNINEHTDFLEEIDYLRTRVYEPEPSAESEINEDDIVGDDD